MHGQNTGKLLTKVNSKILLQVELQFYLESKRLTASALPWRAEIQHFTEWVKILEKYFYGISCSSRLF